MRRGLRPPSGTSLLARRRREDRERFKAHTIERAPASWYADAIELPEAEVERLLAAPAASRSTRRSWPPRPRGARAARRAGTCSRCRSCSKDGSPALIVLGVRRRPRARGRTRVSLLRDLADRVAVALATAARDRELLAPRALRRAHPAAQPARSVLERAVARELARAERQRRSLAVLFIDLDGFARRERQRSATPPATSCCAQAAARLRCCVRKSDIVARLGGDEFTVVLPELRDAADAATGRRATSSRPCRQPFQVGPSEAFVSASVGIALYPSRRHQRRGAAAPRRPGDVPRQGSRPRRRYAFFERLDERRDRSRAHGARARAAQRARRRASSCCYYQPQLDLQAGRIVGAEALLRWMHPQRGAGRAAAVHRLRRGERPDRATSARWVLRRRVQRSSSTWRAQGVPLDHVSVNVSPRQFRNPDFTEHGAPAVAARVRHDAGAALRLEITESVLIDRQRGRGATLAGADARSACALELDDFGTGYSSLALPAAPPGRHHQDRPRPSSTTSTDERSARRDRARRDRHGARAREGAWSPRASRPPSSSRLLRTMGCDAIQGYLLSKPVPAEGFVELVRDAAAAHGAERPGTVVPLTLPRHEPGGRAAPPPEPPTASAALEVRGRARNRGGAVLLGDLPVRGRLRQARRRLGPEHERRAPVLDVARADRRDRRSRIRRGRTRGPADKRSASAALQVRGQCSRSARCSPAR